MIDQYPLDPMTIVILYASQTGQAQQVAEGLHRFAYKSGFGTIPCISLDCYSIKRLYSSPSTLPSPLTPTFITPPPSIAIFVTSTMGQGVEPDTMNKFWIQLKNSKLPSNLLERLNVAVFGLGDSSYETFNFASKRLYRRLIQLGAMPIIERGDGDDQDPLGASTVLIPWREKLFNQLSKMGYKRSGAITENILFPPKAQISYVNDENHSLDSFNLLSLHSNYNHNSQFPSFPLLNTRLLEKKRITSQDHFQNVYHVTLEKESKEGNDFNYEPGDIAILRPENTTESVDEILALLNLNPKRLIRIESHNFNIVCSIKDLFSKYFDLNRPPSRYFFELLAHWIDSSPSLSTLSNSSSITSSFTNSNSSMTIENQNDNNPELKLMCKEKLLELGCDPDETAYLNYCWRPKRRPFEVFNDFKSFLISNNQNHDNLNLESTPNSNSNNPLIPIEYLCDLFPLISNREFSIASYSKEKIELAIALVHYNVPSILKERIGLCSAWMEKWQIGDMIKVQIKRGTLSLPKSINSMLLLNENENHANNTDKNENHANNILFDSSLNSNSNSPIPLVLMCSGTGISPMRSIIHQNAIKKNDRDKCPIYLFFGCRFLEKDFLFRDEWNEYSDWLQVFAHGSRDDESLVQGKKIYLQDILISQSNLLKNLCASGAYFFLSGNSRLASIIKQTLIDILGKKEFDTIQKSKRYQSETWS